MVKRAVEQQQQSAGWASPEPLPESVFSTAFGLTIRTRPESNRAAAADDEEEKTPSVTIIYADLLIPGAGDPLPDAALVIEDQLIAWVGARSAVPPAYAEATGLRRTVSVPYLLPGLWDCHVHCGGESTADPPALPFLGGPPAASGARLARGLWTALQRGYTSLRDVAGYGCEAALAIDDGTIAGPHVYGCGAALSQTGGHGDITVLPPGDALAHLGVGPAALPGGASYGQGKIALADGADECRRAVRLQVRRGARCIKVFASGGVRSRGDDLEAPQFSEEELRCVVAEAARHGSRAVAAHLHGRDAILAALAAGVRTVEHGSFADQACVDRARALGAVWVATRTVVDLLLRSGGEGLPRETWDKARRVGRHHAAAYRRAVAAGVTCALGTDTQPGFNMAIELEHAVAAGMSHLEAIRAATAHGPLTLGGQAPRSGQLKPGYEADVIGVLENPAEDVRVLQKIHNIKWVWKGGKLFKGPGVGPWGEED